MESVILVLNILILALILGGAFYFYQKNSKKKLEEEIEDQSELLAKKDELNELVQRMQLSELIQFK